MNFLNRFSIFSIGIIIGVFIIITSMKTRKETISFNYLPSDRIKSYLLKHDINYIDYSLCQLQLLKLDTLKIYSYIENSKVNFKKSKIRGYDCKIYYLINKNISDNSVIEFVFTKCDTTIILKNIIYDVNSIQDLSIESTCE